MVLSGVEVPGVEDGTVVLSGETVSGVLGMLLGVVVESVGLLPSGEIAPPGTAVGIFMPPGVVESLDEGTTTSAPEPPEVLGAAEGLVGVPPGAALGLVVELVMPGVAGVSERSKVELPGVVERSRVGPMLEGSAVGAEEGFVGVPLGAAVPPGVPLLSRFGEVSLGCAPLPVD